MSKLLLKNKCFLHLLYTTEPTQQKALLKTITIRQVSVIGEIFFNLLHNVRLTTKQRSVINLRRRVLSKIANGDIPIKLRRNYIDNHPRIVLQTLLLVKSELLDLLET